MCMSFLCACIVCMPGVHGGQKRVPDALGLEFQWMLRSELGSLVLLTTEPSFQLPLHFLLRHWNSLCTVN